MSDNILRLKVDSKEYDANLKRAAQGLLQLEAACRKTGGILNVLEDENRDFIRSLGQMDTQATNTKGALREMTQTIMDLTTVYRRMSDEEKQGEFGRELSKQISVLEQRAGVLRDTMDDVNATIKHSASDTRTFDQISASIQGLVSSFQIVTGSAELFGIEIGDNVEVLAKLQSAMAVTSGLTQGQNLLQKQSAVMMGLSALQAKALAAAQALNGKNTAIATAAQVAFNLAAKMNPYLILATAAVAAGVAIVAYTQKTKAAAAETKRLQEESKRLRETEAKTQAALGQAVGDTLAQYRSLQAQWSLLKNASERNQWIHDNANAFKQLGLHVNGVADAEKVLVTMAPQVVAALRAVAEAEAYNDLYKKAVKDRAEKWEFRVKSRTTGDYVASVSDADRTSRGTISDEWKAAGITNKDYTYTARNPALGSGSVRTVDYFRLTQSGEEKLLAYRKKMAAETNSALKKRYDEQVDMFGDAYEKSIKKAAEAKSKISNLFTPTSVGPSPVSRTQNSVNEVVKEEEIFPIGSVKQLEQELSNLREQQKLSTSAEEWMKYADAIETVNNKIKKITETTQDLSSVTGSNIQSFISDLQNQIKSAPIGSELYNNLTAQLADANSFANILKEYVSKGIDIADLPTAELWKKILLGDGDTISDEVWSAVVADLNAKLMSIGKTQKTLDFHSGNLSDLKTEEKNNDKMQQLGATLSRLGSSLSSINSGLQNMGVKLPEKITTAINAITGLAQVINGVSSIIQLFGSGSQTLNTAAVNANTTAIIGLISSLNLNTATNAIPFFASGGIAHAANGLHISDGSSHFVPGSSFSGDKVPALLNSGELILNRAQQGNLASQMMDSGSSDGELVTSITAEQLYILLNNYGRRKGLGKLKFG